MHARHCAAGENGRVLDPHTALAAAARPLPQAASTLRRVLLLGGGGALGTAVLGRLLADHRFATVGVLADAALQPTLRRLQAVQPEGAEAFGADTALIVFDRERHANGREAAFVRTEPAELTAWARRLRAAGVQTLLVVVPHRAALLPAALKAGLASLDEGTVAALGFRQLVFMRMSQAGGSGDAGGGSWPQRLGHWLIGQMHWMVPQREQPVRAATVARVAVELALQLPAAAPATRVLAPEWLWHAAQASDPAPLLAAWLAGQPPPAQRVPTTRM
jgi:hypothetical protein